MSKSQVSELAKNLDEKVAEFRNRPRRRALRLSVARRALPQGARGGPGRLGGDGGRDGVNAEGHREILGVDVFSAEDGAGWTAFLRARRPRPVGGRPRRLRCARGAEGRDRRGPRRGLLAALSDPRHAQLVDPGPEVRPGIVATLVRTIFAQPDATQVHAQFNRVVDQLTTQFPAAPSSSSTPKPTSWPSRVPARALAPDLEQQPPGTAQPRDPPAHRRRRDLPQPRRLHPPRRRGARRAARRVGGRPALHEPESLAKTRVRVIVGGAIEDKEVGTTAELEAVS